VNLHLQDDYIPAILGLNLDPAKPEPHQEALAPFSSFDLVLLVQAHREDDTDIAGDFHVALPSQCGSFDIVHTPATPFAFGLGI
jgi:hypothetical protein